MRQTLKNVILTVETVVDQASLQFYEQIARFSSQIASLKMSYFGFTHTLRKYQPLI